MRDTLGHKDFVIGAAADGDTVDASEETVRLCVEVSKHCNFPATHSSRKGGATPEGTDGRIRRWVDHLEAAYDITLECRKVNPDIRFYQEESMGHASQQYVPIGNGRTYEREYDPECALMAAVTSETAEQIYCYHYISQQDDGTPGLELIGQVLSRYPADWTYKNDSWGGSPSHGFSGGEGKVRHTVRAPDARTLGYTRTGPPTIAWSNGYSPREELHRGRYAVVYVVRQ
jgi:hypothetical protein